MTEREIEVTIMKRMLLLPIAIFLLGAGGRSHSAGETTNGKNKDAYVIVTDTESNPEELSFLDSHLAFSLRLY